MDCPACHTANPSGQKFCGACGRKLESACPSCGAPNPPQYKFCGECGGNLAVSGTLWLATTGLITKANPKALALLGYGDNEVEGKPFSLFVEREDLVVFFSHWNELRSSAKRQSFEIALKHKDGKSLYLLVDLDSTAKGNPAQVRVLLNEITDSREDCARMQFQEDLLNLIFSTTDAIRTASHQHLDRSIQEALKKLCLVTEADRSFIYSFNRQLKCVDPAYQWCKAATDKEATPEFNSVPLTMIKRAIVRLREEQVYVVDDMADLALPERQELMAWHHIEMGAVACQLIYSSKRPIGIIGISKDTADGQWDPQYVALVKFLGQVLADRLPFAAIGPTHGGDDRRLSLPPDASGKVPDSQKRKVIDITKKRYGTRTDDDEEIRRRPHPNPASDASAIRDRTSPMLIEPSAGRKTADQQSVFPREDGGVLLTCPRCGIQESVSADQFEKLGNALSVTCPCQKNFSAVLEKRRAFRKAVRLPGHFALKGAMEPRDATHNISGLMVVRDLSKAGLRFSTTKADLLHPGDQLMVRFHLDNSNQALIHKPARVIFVTDNEVGCRFVGDDSYDITLGFYFI